MRNLFFTFFFVLMATAGAWAQAQIGIRAGLNVATISDGVDVSSAMTGDVQEPWIPGMVVGVASSFGMSEVFAIAPELNFSQRGYRFEGPQNIDVRYNYLELPVLARLSFGQTLKGYVNLGPTFSYLLNGKREVSGSSSTGPNIPSIDYGVGDAGFNRFELGGALGGGVQLNTGAGSFLVDLRYTQGFTDFRKDGFDEPYLSGNPEQYKNRLVSVSLIYLIPGIGATSTRY